MRTEKIVIGIHKLRLSRRLVRAKTCEGCRALGDEQGYGLRCKLGAPYECTPAGIPVRPCPKPRTYKEWFAK